MDKAITALDYAKREKHKNTRARIKHLATRWGWKLVEETAGKPVQARIDFGRWIADCECGGAEAVDPKDPVFFCVSCGNSRNSGRLREVIFPDDIKAVEAEVMSLPLKRRGIGDVINQQLKAVPASQPRS